MTKSSSGDMEEEGGDRGIGEGGERTGCARNTAFPPASTDMRENGRKELSVST